MKKNNLGLYIHIPFCDNICAYCGFSKLFYVEKFANSYLDALENELKKYQGLKFYSIYIGGGTPTSLNIYQFDRLFKLISEFKSDDATITIETNPNLSDEKISLLKKYNVNRISIGIQTFNKRLLNLINRPDYTESLNVLINKIKEAGINDINCDLIYGLPTQTNEDIKEDLNKFMELDVTHISTYCLQVESGTIFYNQKIEEADEFEARSQYDLIYDFLKEKGYNRYEVSNFAKEGYESKHNLIYWRNQEYIGVGLSASSYYNNKRFTNTKNFNEYLKGNYIDYSENLTIEDKKFYFIMLGLRLEKGISVKEYQEEFNSSIFDDYKGKITPLIENKSLDYDGEYLKISKEYMYIMNTILSKILIY